MSNLNQCITNYSAVLKIYCSVVWFWFSYVLWSLFLFYLPIYLYFFKLICMIFTHYSIYFNYSTDRYEQTEWTQIKLLLVWFWSLLLVIPSILFGHITIGINLYHSLGIFSRRQIDDIFLIFPRKQDTTFHANCLLMSYPVFWEK